MQTLIPPPARRLDDLVAGMPGRGRCLSEAGWVVATLLALARELRVTLPAFALLVVGHLGVSMVVGLMALAFAGGSLQAEVGQRQVVAGALASEQMIRMVPLLLVAGATEEIAFRGFLLPRLRITLGRWITAVLAGAALFGSGHFTAAAGGCDPLSALGRCPPKRATESL